MAFLLTGTAVSSFTLHAQSRSEQVHSESHSSPKIESRKCMDELQQLKNKVLIHLDQKIKTYRENQDCLMSFVQSRDCSRFQQHVIAELDKLAQHRLNQTSIDMRFERSGGFVLRTAAPGLGTSADGGVTLSSGALTNGRGQRIQGLSPDEQADFWQRHRRDLSQYLATEWWPAQSVHFPHWRQCLQTVDERIVVDDNRMEYQGLIERSPDKHLVFPRFVPKYKCTPQDTICRTTHNLCRKIFEFWASAPYGPDYDRFRKSQASRDDRQLNSGLEPWVYNVSESIREKSDVQKMLIARSAFKKLGGQAEKLRSWVAGLSDYQLLALREFTSVNGVETAPECRGFKRRGIASLFCDDHGIAISGSRLVDECIAGSFITANAVLAVFKDFHNDRAYLVGLKGDEQWRQFHDRNAQEGLRSAIFGPVETAVVSSGVGAAIKSVSPVFKKAVAHQKPGGSSGTTKSPSGSAPLNAPLNTSSTRRASTNGTPKVHNADAGVEKTVSSVKISRAFRETDPPDVPIPPDSRWFILENIGRRYEATFAQDGGEAVLFIRPVGEKGPVHWAHSPRFPRTELNEIIDAQMAQDRLVAQQTGAPFVPIDKWQIPAADTPTVNAPTVNTFGADSLPSASRPPRRPPRGGRMTPRQRQRERQYNGTY
ncbi:MAG: hypothetical protein AB7G93_07065 [Bdellovibrionales bacterium]